MQASAQHSFATWWPRSGRPIALALMVTAVGIGPSPSSANDDTYDWQRADRSQDYSSGQTQSYDEQSYDDRYDDTYDAQPDTYQQDPYDNQYDQSSRATDDRYSDIYDDYDNNRTYSNDGYADQDQRYSSDDDLPSYGAVDRDPNSGRTRSYQRYDDLSDTGRYDARVGQRDDYRWQSPDADGASRRDNRYVEPAAPATGPQRYSGTGPGEPYSAPGQPYRYPDGQSGYTDQSQPYDPNRPRAYGAGRRAASGAWRSDAYSTQSGTYAGESTYDDGYGDETYSSEEIATAGHRFFGSVSAGLASVIEYTFQRAGRPNGYILGEEAGGAVVAGVRYGEGRLHTKNGGVHKVFWQGPSIGYDFGAEGSKTMILVYNLYDPSDIYNVFGGVDGSAYLVGGVGVTFQRFEHVTLAPIRSGVGLRLGANIGYLRYTRTPSWLPF